MVARINLMEIKKYPDEILRAAARKVEQITDKEVDLLKDMCLIMYNNKGIGLAAPQVGSSLRLIVIDVGDGPIKLINPEILSQKGQCDMEEGCLSLPGREVKIMRAEKIEIRALNEKGEEINIKAEGLLARAILHEIDHLDGKLIIDYIKTL